MSLDDVKQTLEFILTDEDCYDAADLYICTTVLNNSDEQNTNYQSSPEIRGSTSNGSEDEQERIQSLLNKLKLLRGYKQFLADHNNINEDFIFAMEDVLEIPIQDLLGIESMLDLVNVQSDIVFIVEQQKNKILELYDQFAYELVPTFVRYHFLLILTICKFSKIMH